MRALAGLLTSLRRKPPRQAPRTAIVLLHGYLGFAPNALYWRQSRPLVDELRARGYAVLLPKLPATRGVERRALRLRKLLLREPAERLVLVGHSMGGLDARGLATHLDPEQRVRAVVTLGTPHRGSALARWARESRGGLPFLARRLDRGALYDLTPEGAAAFNAAVPDRPDVVYLAVVATRPVAEQARLLQRFGRIMAAAEGANDGMVGAASARWGERQIKVRADHFELIGWALPPADPEIARPFDHQAMLRQALGQALRAIAPAGVSRP